MLQSIEGVTIRTAMHPDYFETHFHVQDPVPCWPNEFVIISAFATTGKSWTLEENQAADENLIAKLRKRGCWITRVTGYSPRTGHSEPSWAAEIPLYEACDLGMHFRQDAIYHVLGDVLSVTNCDREGKLVPVGGFRERLHTKR